eukprot:CAMPEP_0119316084 /NCGR_PEP_ID=MMETSP1333-20130426/38455_1 /TAXON_ID=418940 /ORGANISM="Scyphosphaera apsteinii, Strain RCC1455" /LENGTH=337 /DNA_ID=CAMNT_0007321633 /DNA_START=270 /DNA_END=1283 /DNA_ORIENTATION=-
MVPELPAGMLVVMRGEIFRYWDMRGHMAPGGLRSRRGNLTLQQKYIRQASNRSIPRVIQEQVSAFQSVEWNLLQPLLLNGWRVRLALDLILPDVEDVSRFRAAVLGWAMQVNGSVNVSHIRLPQTTEKHQIAGWAATLDWISRYDASGRDEDLFILRGDVILKQPLLFPRRLSGFIFPFIDYTWVGNDVFLGVPATKRNLFHTVMRNHSQNSWGEHLQCQIPWLTSLGASVMPYVGPHKFNTDPQAQLNPLYNFVNRMAPKSQKASWLTPYHPTQHFTSSTTLGPRKSPPCRTASCANVRRAESIDRNVQMPTRPMTQRDQHTTNRDRSATAHGLLG